MNRESQIQNINVDLIIPNRFQPRLTFDENALNDLANSIKEHGVIQPLVLRRLNDKYEIIAGERRYKASILAGLTEVPAIITSIDDNESAEVALVENVQRKNLNSMEEAKSYKKILDKGYLTQDALAKKMGISQSALANKLRLLNLAPEVQEALVNNRISERHARSLLMVDDKLRQVGLLNRVIADRLTVRQLDELIKGDSNLVVENNQDVLPTDQVVNSEPVNSNVNDEIVQPIDSKDTINENQPFNIFNNSNESNIFDNHEDNSSNDQVINDIQESVNNDNSKNLFDVNDSENNVVSEENSEVKEESIDSLDTLDNLEDNTEKTDSKGSIFDIFKGSSVPSLEDEKMNLNIGNDEYFNPFVTNDEEIEEQKDIKSVEEKKIEPVMVPEKIVKKGDFSSIKVAYSNLKKEIEEAGFKISTEDFDFEDIYQIIIKIDKQD